MIACANEILGKDAAFHFHMTRRQNELSNFVEKKMVEILQKTKFFIQVDESTIHNQAILLVYVRFIHEDYIIYIYKICILYKKLLPWLEK